MGKALDWATAVWREDSSVFPTYSAFLQSFKEVFAQTNWVEDTLKLLFRKGLSLELQAELACRDEGKSLNDFIELTIRIYNFLFQQ